MRFLSLMHFIFEFHSRGAKCCGVLEAAARRDTAGILLGLCLADYCRVTVAEALGVLEAFDLESLSNMGMSNDYQKSQFK